MAAKMLEIARAWTETGVPFPIVELRDGTRLIPTLRLTWLDDGAVWAEPWEELIEYREPGTGFIRDPVLLAPSRDFEIPTREEALEYNAQAPQLTTDCHDVTADDWDIRLAASGRLSASKAERRAA